MILSAGDKGKRFMTPHATAMLHQPKVPSTGERQATELQIKWKEVHAQKKVLVNILTKTTGHTAEKIERVREQKTSGLKILNSLRTFKDLCI